MIAGSGPYFQSNPISGLGDCEGNVEWCIRPSVELIGASRLWLSGHGNTLRSSDRSGNYRRILPPSLGIPALGRRRNPRGSRQGLGRREAASGCLRGSWSSSGRLEGIPPTWLDIDGILPEGNAIRKSTNHRRNGPCRNTLKCCDRRLMLNYLGCNQRVTLPPGSPTGRSSPRTDPTARPVAQATQTRHRRRSPGLVFQRAATRLSARLARRGINLVQHRSRLAQILRRMPGVYRLRFGMAPQEFQIPVARSAIPTQCTPGYMAAVPVGITLSEHVWNY
jgi:hypothetical protein